MTIDHGLQGRDNAKSRQRRTKKAAKVKAIALSSINKKGEVLYDENSRVEYLTGFRKRKQERRKFGLAMQLLKDKQKNKDVVKSRKKALQSAIQDVASVKTQEESDNEPEEEVEKIVFDDKNTQDMFGSCVSVTVDTCIPESHPSQNFGLQERKPKKENSNFQIRLEKAMKKVSQTMNMKKRRTNPTSQERFGKKLEAKQLLHKAFGGQNYSKGRGKKRT